MSCITSPVMSVRVSTSSIFQFGVNDLQLKTFGFPPLEDREKSRAMLAGIDFFGGGSLAKEEMVRLADVERGAFNDMFVILSDIWVDHEEKTMEKLEIILSGYENENVVPSLFRPSNALPRCSLPKYIIEEFQNHIPNAAFMINPCRYFLMLAKTVSCLTKLEYHESPLKQLGHNSILQLVATIVHQSHLCPLPLSIQPISWNFDHSLHLYPTPQTIILGDRSEQKAFKYTGITCFNPGSFSNDFAFVAYRPCSQEVELSAV
ncbi:hypothetical protein SASPL_138840 [Salvia splendens]|uniref:DNA polymerase II subunit 2 n=1 Tax=Salvia splendens TaxID=180675 RepID=A0A8X8ZEN7_SALSN|nr:hypothetical protein SASPL_138840 [Salvia splendens]